MTGQTRHLFPGEAFKGRRKERKITERNPHTTLPPPEGTQGISSRAGSSNRSKCRSPSPPGKMQKVSYVMPHEGQPRITRPEKYHQWQRQFHTPAEYWYRTEENIFSDEEPILVYLHRKVRRRTAQRARLLHATFLWFLFAAKQARYI